MFFSCVAFLLLIRSKCSKKQNALSVDALKANFFSVFARYLTVVAYKFGMLLWCFFAQSVLMDGCIALQVRGNLNKQLQ